MKLIVTSKEVLCLMLVKTWSKYQVYLSPAGPLENSNELGSSCHTLLLFKSSYHLGKFVGDALSVQNEIAL